MARKDTAIGIGSAGSVGKGSLTGSGHSAGEEIQRWTTSRKAAAVLDIIKGKPPSTPADAARLHGLTVADLESWIEKFMEGGREGLRAVPRDLEAKFEAERKDLLAKVGELTLQVDVLKKTSRSASGLMGASGQGRERGAAVVAALAAEGKRAPVAEVCRLLGVPRSTA